MERWSDCTELAEADLLVGEGHRTAWHIRVLAFKLDLPLLNTRVICVIAKSVVSKVNG